MVKAVLRFLKLLSYNLKYLLTIIYLRVRPMVVQLNISRPLDRLGIGIRPLQPNRDGLRGLLLPTLLAMENCKKYGLL